MSAALQNAKGPARIAVLPSHGPNNPAKEMKMDSSKPTTGPAEAPAPKDLSDLFENPINDALRMSSILATLLESNLEKDMTTIVGDRGKNSYFINKGDVEDILFSIYKIQDHVARINAAFMEATA